MTHQTSDSLDHYSNSALDTISANHFALGGFHHLRPHAHTTHTHTHHRQDSTHDNCEFICSMLTNCMQIASTNYSLRLTSLFALAAFLRNVQRNKCNGLYMYLVYGQLYFFHVYALETNKSIISQLY